MTVATPLPGGVTQIANTATIADDGTNGADPTPGNNTGSDTTPVIVADVSIVKTLTTAGPYTAGQSISYSLVVSNSGPSTATNVQVTDAPTNLTITNVTGSGCAALPCTIASLAVGANTSITVTATIDAAGAFDNSATVTAAEPDPDPSNNTDNTGNGGLTGVSADVSVVKTLDTAGPYSVGQTVTFTLTVANAGPSPATSIQVTDTPANLTITNVAGSGCAALPCTIASLAVGANTSITVTATIDAAGAFDNGAAVTATEPDPNDGNNSDENGNGGTAPAGSVDLAITKAISTTTPAVGQPFDYTIVVTNLGPGDATNVVVTDSLPATFALVSASSTQGSCSGTTTVTCSLGAMPNGGSATITIAGHATAAGSLSNTASVAATEVELSMANNDATALASAHAEAVIPTLDEWGLMLLALGLALAGLFAMKRM
ncbi:MAG: DUF11 domain-containing protein [Acidobacteria bacterium]|nr:DUF11 domain-containing protein [Acidobacteriota bacterium]